MAVTRYKWDVEELNALSLRIKSENEKLSRDSAAAENIKNDIRGAWQSVAGEEYIQNMEIDKNAIDQMINKMETLRDNIERAANIYKEAEDTINSYVNQMRSSIVH